MHPRFAILVPLLALTLACASPQAVGASSAAAGLSDPRDLALVGEAAAAISDGDPERALTLIDAVVEGGASDVTIWFLRGVANLALDRVAVACLDLQRAVDLKPDDAPSHCVLARAFRELGDLDASAGSLRRALEIDPELTRMRTLLGHVYLEMGALVDAYEMFLQVVEEHPDDGDAHRGLGMLFAQVGDPEHAELAWRHVLDIEPEDALLHLGLGNALRDQGRLVEALDSYRAAIRIEPDAPLHTANEASTLFEMGRLRDARAAYERLLTLDPLPPRQRPWVLLNLGSLLELIGEDDAAMDVYEMAVEEDPEFTDGYEALGLLQMEHDRPQRALRHLRRALELDGLSAEGTMRLALLAESNGDPGSARRCAEMLSLASVADPEVAFRYAQLLVASRLPEIRDNARAADIIQELLASGPEEDGALWDLLGQAFFEQGAIDRAVSAAERALQSADPSHPAWERYTQRHTLYLSSLDVR